MSLSDNYRQLAALIETLESQGVTVQQAVPVSEAHEASSDGSFVVRLEVGLPEDGAVETLTFADGPTPPDQTDTVETDSVDSNVQTDDASGRDETETVAEPVDETQAVPAETSVQTVDARSDTDAPVASASAESASTSAESASTTEDAESAQPVGCTEPDCDRTFETERGMKIHRTKAHPLSGVADRTNIGPVHSDPEALQRVYDEHETFAEMTAALDVDVGAQAVRKQMIRHGIHEPGGSVSKTTPGDSHEAAETVAKGGGDEDDSDGTDDTESPDGTDDTESPDGTDDTESPDGTDDTESPDESLPPLDLPRDLTAAALKTAVEEANTLYDVQRSLGLDRATTKQILETYDLLDLVTGRASTAQARKEQKDELNERLRRAAT